MTAAEVDFIGEDVRNFFTMLFISKFKYLYDLVELIYRIAEHSFISVVKKSKILKYVLLYLYLSASCFLLTLN